MDTKKQILVLLEMASQLLGQAALAQMGSEAEKEIDSINERLSGVYHDVDAHRFI